MGQTVHIYRGLSIIAQVRLDVVVSSVSLFRTLLHTEIIYTDAVIDEKQMGGKSTSINAEKY